MNRFSGGFTGLAGLAAFQFLISILHLHPSPFSFSTHP